MESYSSGRRGAPAKGVGVEMRARVQIPHSPPKNSRYNNGYFFIFRNVCRGFGPYGSMLSPRPKNTSVFLPGLSRKIRWLKTICEIVFLTRRPLTLRH